MFLLETRSRWRREKPNLRRNGYILFQANNIAIKGVTGERAPRSITISFGNGIAVLAEAWNPP
jgi:hypothetical protein